MVTSMDSLGKPSGWEERKPCPSWAGQGLAELPLLSWLPGDQLLWSQPRLFIPLSLCIATPVPTLWGHQSPPLAAPSCPVPHFRDCQPGKALLPEAYYRCAIVPSLSQASAGLSGSLPRSSVPLALDSLLPSSQAHSLVLANPPPRLSLEPV